MNLFVTDRDPDIAAQDLDDIRLNKMITESCQMLVIAMVANGLPKNQIPLTKSGQPYKTKGHANHPVTIWTGRTQGNFMWHTRYATALMSEYEFRFEKKRAGMDVLQLAWDRYQLMPEGALEPFQNSSLYQSVPNTVAAYRTTMIEKWNKDIIKVKWTKRIPPYWSPVKTVLIDNISYRFTDQEAQAVESSLLEHPA